MQPSTILCRRLDKQFSILAYQRLQSTLNSIPPAGTRNIAPVLIDSFGRSHNYLRMSLTEKCNLRCSYCMPAEGVTLTPRHLMMSLEERMRVITIFARLGVNKMRFTGGEPTISNQLTDLIRHAAAAGITSIGITTNGLMIGKNEDILDKLVSAGLTSINISLDTLSADKFASITRRPESNMYSVLSCLYKAAARPSLKVKLNCVLLKGVNDDELVDFVQLVKSSPISCRFIELMPFDGNEWTNSKMMSYLEAIDVIHDRARRRTDSHLFQLVEEKNSCSRYYEYDRNDTTKWYRAISKDGSEFEGRVGFITSMTSHFCGGCNRLRVTADGNLKVCLFGSDSFNILTNMREGASDDDIVRWIGDAVKGKHAVLGGHKSPEDIAESNINRPMILIGG